MTEERIQYIAQVLIWIHSLLKNYGVTGSHHTSNFGLPYPYTPLWHVLNGMRISKLHIYTFWILTWPLGLNQCIICKNVICLMAGNTGPSERVPHVMDLKNFQGLIYKCAHMLWCFTSVKTFLLKSLLSQIEPV